MAGKGKHRGGRRGRWGIVHAQSTALTLLQVKEREREKVVKVGGRVRDEVR